MKFSSLFKSTNYIKKTKSIIKSSEIRKLAQSIFPYIELNNIWRTENSDSYTELDLDLSNFNIFGRAVDLNCVDWHRDYVSGFGYPQERFDKLRISKWFDKGIDVKFPWELSRFYFAVRLAQNYQVNQSSEQHKVFTALVTSWIANNPFCFGVNWNCTMEVAIRAINWIVSANIFGDILKKDENFGRLFSKSLIQHAEYISAFPEIYEKNHTANHTTADYTGLLFLGICLKNYFKSEMWLKQSVKGLEECIRYQTYEDGVNFESSIPYHRLVLEMFSYAAIVCRANDISLSQQYYELTFKMFEYAAAYIDHNGNAPQVGDNDSGRLLIFHDSEEHDHSYLLDLGEHIFDYKFKSLCKKRNPDFVKWLPNFEKLKLSELNLRPRETDNNIAFDNGGAYFLKNDNFSLMIACFRNMPDRKGVHNHLDIGSFTLSYKGQPIIVDPGSYVYTRNFKIRNKFRNYNYHNVVLIKNETIPDISKNMYFKIETEKDLLDEDRFVFQVNNQYASRLENFKLNAKSVSLSFNVKGHFKLFIHLGPGVIIEKEKIGYHLNDLHIILDGQQKSYIREYEYSPMFNHKVSSKILIIDAFKELIVQITL